MHRIGRDFDLLIVDEVHHFGVGIRDEALEMSIAAFRLGLTATPPDAPALRRLSDLIGPVVYRLGVGDLAGTWLADFDLVVLQLGLDEEERERYASDHLIFSEVNRRFRDERRRCSDAELPHDARVVRYRTRIDPVKVLAIVDPRVTSAGATVSHV